MSQNVRSVKDHVGKWKAALFRVSGASQVVAAASAGVTDRTIRRWEKRDPQYWRYAGEIQDRLRATAWGEVWLTLRAHLHSADPHVSLRAADILLRSIDLERPQGPTTDPNATSGVLIYTPTEDSIPNAETVGAVDGAG
jgi:hypothetical protein